MDFIDLHVHTTYSDGSQTVASVLRLAQAKGLKAIAITDHDTVDGIGEALAIGKELGIEVVPGVEMSARYGDGEIHILGYELDWKNPALIEQLDELKEARDKRNPEIVARLQGFGFDLDYAEVKKVAGQVTVGRPHIAQVLLKKGFVKSIAEAFELYLREGAPAYVPRVTLEPETAIDLILSAGGIPVLAHPSRLQGGAEELERLCSKLVAAGLIGMEVHYSTHQPGQVQAYGELAKRYGLLVTGGSDFHGDSKPAIALGSGTGTLQVPHRLLEEMRLKAAAKNW